MVVKNVQITILIEDHNSSSKPHLKAKHGLAYFIKAKTEAGDVTIMMDTGPTPEILLYNVDAMEMKLQNVDIIALSHGHYDHTGGLIEVLKHIKKRVPVIAHPTVFVPKLKITPHLKFIGTFFNSSRVESLGGLPLLAVNPIKIAEGITTTGEVPRKTSFEKVRGFRTVYNRKFVDDDMLDDQSLVIDVDKKGLVVVSGCAHSGIINTIKHAQEITESGKVHAVLGGFHLLNADVERIRATVDELKKINPEFIGPCHCTGKKAIKKLVEIFGDRCRPLHTGNVVEF